MKVIDLLNKIANGEEVPGKIQVYSDIFVFENSNNIYEHEETRTNLLSIYNGNILNYKVEIIEEDKKIEKLDTSKYFYVGPYTENQPKRYDIDVFNKINEIIDYINKEEK